MNTLESRGSGWVQRSLRAVLYGLLLAGACVNAAPADEATPSDQNDPFPISIKLEPSLVVVYEGEGGKAGRKVTISGSTIKLGPASNRPVTIAIERDDPSLHTKLDAAVDKQGHYSNGEFGAVEPGEYRITATAPDGRGTATATLTAISVPQLADRAPESLTRAAETVDGTMADVEKKVDEKPESPAKAETRKKIAAIREAHKAFEQADPAGAIHGFLGAIYEHPALLEKQAPRLREVAEDLDKLEQQTAQVKRMQSQLSSADEGCEQMAFVLEVVKAVGTLASFEGKLLKQVAGMSKDVLADVESNAVRGLGGGATGGFIESFLVKNGSKLEKGEPLIDGPKGAVGMMSDFASFGVEQLFDAYCQRFSGPFEGTFIGRFYRMVHGKRTMWWKQKYRLTGRILLRYPKSATGKHVKMTGRIEGYAHSFGSWDNGMKAFDDTGIMKGTITAKLRYPPLDAGETISKAVSQGKGLLSAQVWGSFAGMALPNSFAMKVRGEYDGDSVSLLVGSRITDFTAFDKVVNVIVSPLNTLGPTVVWYPLPYVDAHSVLAGGTGEKPVRMHVTTAGKVLTASGKADNIVNTKHARGEYHLKFKVCNPGC